MHKIDSAILNSILQYLAKQPYEAVYQLINGIQCSQPIVEEPKEEPKKEQSIEERIYEKLD